jgi:putative oxidoreductase
MIKKLLFGGVGGGSIAADLGLLVLRLFAGLSMALAHGLGKTKDPSGVISGAANLGFPAPTFFGWMAAISEFFGGLLLAIGLATRPAAFLIACTMFTAGFLQHASDEYRRKELAFLYLAVAIMFMLTGAGRFSVDGTALRKWSR